MEIRMVAKDFSLTPSLRDYLQCSLHAAFAPMRDKISNIAIRLRDLNAPRGGRDMVCQVSVKMPGQPEVLVNAVQEDMHFAIDYAIRRAAHRAVRLITRKRNSGAPALSAFAV
jgi:ribosome-associated translation inhibitor RaiA